jgi:hypothetical protein
MRSKACLLLLVALLQSIKGQQFQKGECKVFCQASELGRCENYIKNHEGVSVSYLIEFIAARAESMVNECVWL